MLTGAPTDFFPRSTFAYYELVDHRIDALPNVLAAQGYRTVVIHPNDRALWRRESAMPALGFELFKDIESFTVGDVSTHHHVTDLALMRAIVAELEGTSRPTFVMAITMDNHGPWGYDGPARDSGISLPDALSGQGRIELGDYVSRAIDADEAYGFLVEALEKRGKPAIVALYGDHLPGLWWAYQQLCFKDHAPVERHSPPYRIWANFPTPDPPPVLAAYMLPGWVMRSARLTVKGPALANAIASGIVANPTIAEEHGRRVVREHAHVAGANVLAVAEPPR